MKITIIHKYDCPLCEAAINEFEWQCPQMYGSLEDIPDKERRCGMMTDMVMKGGDPSKFPQIFFDDKYVDWKPQKSKGA